ncbi:tetrahydrofolate dehydrogenase/cyclohydrolase catalytic domain-containing protein, partial [Francisella tularensis]|uniref:tetrahydrofolate dehydrogenase/cyclohydrolase catalytic domain-containing protein n=1 Tax=Francisella tularensis TaxID=263 RepID=UPI0023819D35
MIFIDVMSLSIDLKERLATQVQEYKHNTAITPKLVEILVGNDPGSKTYVASKEKACAQ